MGKLDGQVAVVTGAGKGIGRAIALRLAADGAAVVVNYCHSSDAAEKTAEDCRALGVDAVAVMADVSTMEGADALMKEALKMSGRIDILVNNAGRTKDSLLLRMKPDDFDTVVKTNLYGTFYCMKAVSKIMLKQKYGRIISISSIVGLRGNVGQMNYSASKAGILGLTKSMAKEMASRGVTVNAVAPGMIETDMTRAMTEEAHAAMEKEIPAGRIGAPEDVACAVAFFASREAAYVTGQVLAVDGGLAV
ncbi:MAG: 3-oxoacyl-[acyl-carrier-protein] reductase [Lachnospiraceae bacterium]|nr:3-oxoacyl-[acyl-carrier-protein] reductase [Lachnospiraceae bacterium]